MGGLPDECVAFVRRSRLKPQPGRAGPAPRRSGPAIRLGFPGIPCAPSPLHPLEPHGCNGGARRYSPPPKPAASNRRKLHRMSLSDPLMQTLTLVVPLILIFYLLIWRPQQQRMKQMKDMMENVRRGDTVVTAGGIVGRVAKPPKKDDPEITVEIADNVQVRVLQEHACRKCVRRTRRQTPRATRARPDAADSHLEPGHYGAHPVLRHSSSRCRMLCPDLVLAKFRIPAFQHGYARPRSAGRLAIAARGRTRPGAEGRIEIPDWAISAVGLRKAHIGYTCCPPRPIPFRSAFSTRTVMPMPRHALESERRRWRLALAAAHANTISRARQQRAGHEDDRCLQDQHQATIYSARSSKSCAAASTISARAKPSIERQGDDRIVDPGPGPAGSDALKASSARRRA